MSRRQLVIAFIFLLGVRAFAQQSAVEIVGAKDFPPAKLREVIAEQIGEIQSHGLTTARGDDAAFFLAGYYRKQGYARVVVDYELRGGKLILKVTEGPLVLMRSLKFTGNKSVEGPVLAKFFSGVAADELAAEKLPYHESEVAAGGDRVRGYYVSEGWLDATVDTSGTKISADGMAADIVVSIGEGTRYEFGAVTYKSDVSFSPAEWTEALGTKSTGAFNETLVQAMQGSLRAWLRGRGHFAVDVVAEADKTRAVGGKIPVHFVIKAGPKFRVTNVVPSGLDRVKPEFIDKRFRAITQRQYAPALIDEKYRELLRTGLFRTLRVHPRKTGADTLALDLEVEEAKQKEFGFEVGYGTYDGAIVIVRAGDRNVLRSGRPLTVELKSSQRGFEGELLHVDPWFLDSEWSLRTRLSSQFRDEEGYSRQGAGVRIDATRKLSPRLEISAFSEFGATKVTPAGIEPELLGPLSYTVSTIGIAQKLDYRDDVLNPRRGFVFTTSLELNAIDAEPTFGRVTARYSHYRSIGNSLLAAGLRVGWIIPIGDAADVPIDLRYFNGGGGSVRSFAERDLGPRSAGGFPLGGAFYSVANLEWDFPVSGALGGAVFADAGNLKTDASPGLDDFRLGLGVGLRYQLPIGPMRLDYGYNPSPREGEDAGAVHFSFGFAF